MKLPKLFRRKKPVLTGCIYEDSRGKLYFISTDPTLSTVLINMKTGTIEKVYPEEVKNFKLLL